MRSSEKAVRFPDLHFVCFAWKVAQADKQIRPDSSARACVLCQGRGAGLCPVTPPPPASGASSRNRGNLKTPVQPSSMLHTFFDEAATLASVLEGSAGIVIPPNAESVGLFRGADEKSTRPGRPRPRPTVDARDLVSLCLRARTVVHAVLARRSAEAVVVCREERLNDAKDREWSSICAQC